MSSIQELCLQYWNGTVRVFPAIPEGWQDVSFEHFRTDGAFLISAERKAGKNVHVRIFSEQDGQIKIKPNLDGRLSWKGTKKGIKLLENQNGIYLFEIPKGATLLLQGN
ncbi:glycoside hydrolase family 95-like protein [Sphingobacterium bambusae]|uniref:Glycoside hydrolase family 95-like protein n=1 Tax=Sphingobacterium bambusae TaxID=662858 RepID=A0ABW6BG65_9SPHI